MCRAGATFGQLQRSVFSQRGVTNASKCRLYKTLVLTQLTYGAPHTWAPTQQQLHQLDVWHNNNLRRLLHVRLGPDTVSVQQLHLRTGTEAISSMVARRRLQWLGHVGRKGWDSSAGWVSLLLAASCVPGQRRPVGGPPQSWLRAVRQDLEGFGVAHEWWQLCSKDRGAAWRLWVSQLSFQ
jgi:hypothetical protein